MPRRSAIGDAAGIVGDAKASAHTDALSGAPAEAECDAELGAILMRRLTRGLRAVRAIFCTTCRIAREFRQAHADTPQALHVAQRRQLRKRIIRCTPALPFSAPQSDDKPDLAANTGEAGD